jgi:hypothetical protein
MTSRVFFNRTFRCSCRCRVTLDTYQGYEASPRKPRFPSHSCFANTNSAHKHFSASHLLPRKRSGFTPRAVFCAVLGRMQHTPRAQSPERVFRTFIETRYGRFCTPTAIFYYIKNTPEYKILGSNCLWMFIYVERGTTACFFATCVLRACL